MGFYFGIGGVVTFKNAKKLKEAVAYIPLSNIVLETDAPYLTPEPFRGKRNDSSKLVYGQYLVPLLVLIGLDWYPIILLRILKQVYHYLDKSLVRL